MRNKLFILAATIPALVVSSVPSAVVQAADVTKTFKDVSPKNPYYNIISEMAAQGIISGYENGEFSPNEAITRKHAAALVSRAKGNSLPQIEKSVMFKDISESNPNFADIMKLQSAGIFAPDSKGNFNPNKSVTRAEMAKILAIAFGLEVKANYDFPDVPVSHPANKYVRAIYSNGITTGDDGKFLPDKSLTRAHYAVFMHRAMNLDKGHVAKPIEPGKPTNPTQTPTPEPKPGTGNGNNSGTIVDQYDSVFDVPTPPGYVKGQFEEQQIKKHNEARINNKHRYNGALTLFSESSSEYISAEANNVGISVEEMIDIINNAVRTGEVYDGGNFALFYNFSTGQIHKSSRK